MNNSHVIFAIDLNTFKEVGRIENLTSPRYIHFLSDEKAYVTQLWDNRIFIINPKKYEITGYIQVPDMTMESGLHRTDGAYANTSIATAGATKTASSKSTPKPTKWSMN